VVKVVDVDPLLIPANDFGENWAKIFEKPKQKEERE
jgi:hypothetical protein